MNHSDLDAIQSAAYAEGRRDERAEWEDRILPLLRELHENAYLSEQQCAKMFGCDLLLWRFARDKTLVAERLRNGLRKSQKKSR